MDLAPGDLPAAVPAFELLAGFDEGFVFAERVLPVDGFQGFAGISTAIEFGIPFDTEGGLPRRLEPFVLILYEAGTMAPCLRSSSRIPSSGTSRGVVFDCAASAAVAPAAWPMAMHDACTRSPEFARRSLDTQRPATMMLRLSFGTNALKGMVGTVPLAKGLGLTPPRVCKSTG